MRCLALSVPIAFISLALAPSSHAVPSQEEWVQPSQRPPSTGEAGYSTEEALTGGWQTVEFFVHPNRSVRLPDGLPWMEYSARRISGERGQEGETTWATSRSCPALRNTLIWLTTLVAPRIEIAGISPPSADPAGRRPIRITADGLQTTVWGRGTQPDHTAYARVEISSNGGLIAEFGQAATRNLSACWRPEQPDLDAAE